jgi:hypothetical protein
MTIKPALQKILKGIPHREMGKRYSKRELRK